MVGPTEPGVLRDRAKAGWLARQVHIVSGRSGHEREGRVENDGDRVYAGGMSMTMTITLPDNMARRIEAVAAARGETVQEFTVEALDASPLLADPVVDEVDLLEAFLGCGASGDPRPIDIHEMRDELAVGVSVEGVENL